MADEDHGDRTKPALALSGGGFRATLFHLGTVLRLNELGLLAKIERLSSVSGGSIVAGRLAVAWPRLKPVGGPFVNLEDEVIRPLRDFCRRTVDVAAVGWGALLPGRSAGDMVAEAYRDHLVGDIRLCELVRRPQFVLNATNMKTGRLVRFSRRRLADYSIGEIPEPEVGLATAMAASSAFPPVLSPVELEVDPGAWVPLPGARHWGDPDYTRVLTLTDGGAYDNLGLETVDSFSTIIVSDAGAPFAAAAEPSLFWPAQAMRALDIATDQARGLRKRLLHATVTCPGSGRVYAYAGIDGDPDELPAPASLAVDRELTLRLARLATRLAPFDPDDDDRLVNWGWYMTDRAVRSFVLPGAPPPLAWPCPDHPLG